MVRVSLMVVFVSGLLIGAPPAARAQQSEQHAQPQGQPQAQPQAPARGPQPSAESMGISLKSIRQNLDRMPAEKKSTATGLRYDFTVEVLGKRPPIDFFRDFDLSTKGGVRWGTPTHAEILRAVSPNWVTGAMPVGGFDVLDLVRKK